jgi:hypothetical protein
VESSDVIPEFEQCLEQTGKEVEPEEYTTMPQWQKKKKMMKSKGIEILAREFNEEGDAEFVKMRMVAIWEAQETMERGVDERSNPSVFLAQGRRRRETARDSKGFYETLNSKRRQFLPIKR